MKTYGRTSIGAILGLILLIQFGCKKDVVIPPLPKEEKPEIVYPVSKLESHSEINKTTSWYNTNKSFTELFNIRKTQFFGLEMTTNGIIPFIQGTWSESKVQYYYWPEVGMYLYTDLTRDGKKDLYAYYLKAPWPTNARGLNLFCEYNISSTVYDVQFGLTQVRKCVLSDINNDEFNEVVLFSSGYDGFPFPGDSLGIFYPRTLHYEYLSEEIGYFHGGACGDINNDGRVDIVAYSGGSAVILPHPVAYINKGNGLFELSNIVFKGFNNVDPYYTVELFDVNNDNKLDLLIGDLVILQEEGIFDRAKAIELDIDSDLSVMDIAFLDLNEDCFNDLILVCEKGGYMGYSLNIFINKSTSFSKATEKYIENNFGTGQNNWIAWIRLFDYDKDGDIDIVADGLYGDLLDRIIYWDNKEGTFVKTVK